MASTTVSTRLEAEETELLDLLVRLWGLERAVLIRSVLNKGLAEMRRELAVKQYRDDKAGSSFRPRAPEPDESRTPDLRR